MTAARSTVRASQTRTRIPLTDLTDLTFRRSEAG